MEEEDDRVEAEAGAMKKDCRKFILILTWPLPLVASVIPFIYASRKLQKGEYVKLNYFTNTGLAEPKAAATHTDDEAMLPISDPTTRSMNLIPTGTKRSTTSFVPDRELSWNQFLIAIPQILLAMANAKWTD